MNYLYQTQRIASIENNRRSPNPQEREPGFGTDDSAGYFDAPAEVIDRARAYLAKVPGAISGQGGHNATFAIACKLVQGFGLGFEDALALMGEHNEKCEPPWTAEELQHKVSDALEAPTTREPAYLLSTLPPQKPLLPSFGPGTVEHITELACRRRIYPPGIALAINRGVLVFGDWHGNPCWAVKDESGRVIELRRLDGANFPAAPDFGLTERKSHAIKFSQKKWPVGILESQGFGHLALAEGGPDFLYLHARVVLEEALTRVAPVAMLSASPEIHVEALPYFKDKVVRIFPHLDSAGMRGAKRWQQQIQKAGAAEVDFFDLSGITLPDGRPAEDLCDLTKIPFEELEGTVGRILP